MRSGFYRFRQFWLALFQRPNQAQYKRVRSILSPAEYSLFCKMQPGEQLHSIQVMDRLTVKGLQDPHLLAAALLHDVGKSKMLLTIWERVIIVLSDALFHRQAHAWGEETAALKSWRKPFIVSRHHPDWGAQMAARAGSSPQTVYLIRNHQVKNNNKQQCVEDQHLALLQAADNET